MKANKDPQEKKMKKKRDKANGVRGYANRRSRRLDGAKKNEIEFEEGNNLLFPVLLVLLINDQAFQTPSPSFPAFPSQNVSQCNVIPKLL